MECACRNQSAIRSKTSRYDDNDEFCSYNCESWSNKRDSHKNDKKKNRRRVKPIHRDWED